ncbi:MAG: hypothetical protein N3G22_00985 [Candidatus Micrarchaeota archaeon]|nr:hypothetical protein [Candidatus Micrarchaeota archaeon]
MNMDLRTVLISVLAAYFFLLGCVEILNPPYSPNSTDNTTIGMKGGERGSTGSSAYPGGSGGDLPPPPPE